MVRSHMRRFEQHTQQRRLILSLIGIFAIIIFVIFFGFRILVGFSVLVDSLRGTPPQTITTQDVIIAPILDPVKPATNSAEIAVTGSGTPGYTLYLYVNGITDQTTIVEDNGTFTLTEVELTDGVNDISAKLTDGNENYSDVSNVLTITFTNTAPTLEVDNPEEGITVNSNRQYTVTGRTESGVSVTVNGRIAVVSSDGSFSALITLSEGDNGITFRAVDEAGNEKVIERHIRFQM